MDLLVTNLTCERGSRAHRPNKTLSGTNDSEQDTESAPENITPKTKNQRATLDDVSYHKIHFYQTHCKSSVSYLDHAVTVGIGNVWLQASKQGPVVMFEVKVLQSKFRVFNCDLKQNKDIFIMCFGNLNLQQNFIDCDTSKINLISI